MSGFFHLAKCLWGSFIAACVTTLFLWLNNIHIYIITMRLSIRLLLDIWAAFGFWEWCCYKYVWFVHALTRISLCNPLGPVWKSEIAGSYCNSMFNFWKNQQMVCHATELLYIPLSHVHPLLFPPPLPALPSCRFGTVLVLEDVKCRLLWFCFVALQWLMTMRKTFLRYLLVILEKCLLKTFDSFLSWLVFLNWIGN